MKVLTRSCYEAATNCSGRIRSDRQRPVAAANRDRPFLSEHSDDSRLRYYKGGLAEGVIRHSATFAEVPGCFAIASPIFRKQSSADVAVERGMLPIADPGDETMLHRVDMAIFDMAR